MASPRAGGGAAGGAAHGVVHMPEEFICPISNFLMEDPVLAEDGRSYEREMIEAWFAQLAAQGQRHMTSPVTRQRMGRSLRANDTVKRAIAELHERQAAKPGPPGSEEEAEPPDFAPLIAELSALGLKALKIRARAAGVDATKLADADDSPDIKAAVLELILEKAAQEGSADVSSVLQLGEMFAQLDRLRGPLAKCLDGWQPPALVTVGNENSGKSTLLERLCMMPMFPHDAQVCTRLPVQVRLRRGAAAAPRLEVVNTRTGAKESEINIVPMESASVDVRSEMDRLITRQHRSVRGVTSERTIILYVQSPVMPNLDLIDLPGVMENPGAGEPEDMPQQTQALTNAQIDLHKSHSMFLCTVEATTAPNNSTALKLLRQKKVLDKTIGVITKSDYARAEEQQQLVRARLSQTSRDVVALKPHGYVATMIAPKAEHRGLSNLQKLERQAVEELHFFRTSGFQDLVDAEQATTTALMGRINTCVSRSLSVINPPPPCG